MDKSIIEIIIVTALIIGIVFAGIKVYNLGKEATKKSINQINLNLTLDKGR